MIFKHTPQLANKFNAVESAIKHLYVLKIIFHINRIERS
jgi:hypothetical protein